MTHRPIDNRLIGAAAAFFLLVLLTGAASARVAGIDRGEPKLWAAAGATADWLVREVPVGSDPQAIAFAVLYPPTLEQMADVDAFERLQVPLAGVCVYLAGTLVTNAADVRRDVPITRSQSPDDLADQ